MSIYESEKSIAAFWLLVNKRILKFQVAGFLLHLSIIKQQNWWRKFAKNINEE